ncbi:MAG: hypothetical protein V4449_04080 [Patescibacteria group bacterium]
MSVDAPALEGHPSKPPVSLRAGFESAVSFAKKKNPFREKTSVDIEKEEAVKEFKRISETLLARVKQARDAFDRVPQKFSKMTGRSIAPEHKADFDVALAQYRSSVSVYRNFLFQAFDNEAAERFLYAEADKAAGKHTSLLVSKIVGLAGGVGFVAVGGGTRAVASIIPGFVISKVLKRKELIGTVSSRVASDIAKKEVEAKAVGKTHEQFVSENAKLLKERRNSKLWRFSARWGAGVLTSVGTFVVAGDSLAHLSSNLSDQLLNDHLANAWGSKVAESIANGEGSYWQFRAGLAELGNNALHGLETGARVVLGGPASAAELVPTGGRNQFITHFGDAPWARTRAEAFAQPSIRDALNMLIKGGMNPEAGNAFMKAATAQGLNENPQYVEFIKRAWEAQAFRVKGVPQVLGAGADRVVFDASREPGFRGGTPPMYKAEQFSFPYTDSRGFLHNVVIDVPEGKVTGGQSCWNFSLYEDKIVTPPGTPPPPLPPLETPPSPPELVVNRNQWWMQSGGTIIADCLDQCSSADRISNLVGINYIGESALQAKEYVLASVKEGVLGPDYQANIESKFVYIKFTSSLTGKMEYLCLDLKTGQFSHPFVEVNGKSMTITTEAQFQGAITGDGETLRLTGAHRMDDRTILFPGDVIPLTGVDTDLVKDGVPNILVPGTDLNHNGILETSEIGRTRTEIINNQLNFIGRGIIPGIETSDADVGRLEKVFLSKIPEAFIAGKTEGERFIALKAVFGDILNDAEIRELGGRLHLYGEVLSPGGKEKGLAEFTTTDGSPDTIFGFLQRAIKKEVEIGVFADLKKK